jgi:hypothetical protein
MISPQGRNAFLCCKNLGKTVGSVARVPRHSLALLWMLCTNCCALEIDSFRFRLSTLTYATLTTLLTILRDRCTFDCSFWFYSVSIHHFVLRHDFIINKMNKRQ